MRCGSAALCLGHAVFLDSDQHICTAVCAVCVCVCVCVCVNVQYVCVCMYIFLCSHRERAERERRKAAAKHQDAFLSFQRDVVDEMGCRVPG